MLARPLGQGLPVTRVVLVDNCPRVCVLDVGSMTATLGPENQVLLPAKDKWEPTWCMLAHVKHRDLVALPRQHRGAVEPTDTPAHHCDLTSSHGCS
jgi:hypothetical protein